jgi:hypothetical protein
VLFEWEAEGVAEPVWMFVEEENLYLFWDLNLGSSSP